MFFSFSFTWPHTNVFDRVNVNRVGFGKQKKQIHMSPIPPHYFLLATHMTFIPTILFIYLFIYFPYSLLYSPLGFKQLFRPMYFFYPSTTTHFFFSLSFFSFLSFALVDFGGWFLLGFFVLFVLGHFYKSWGPYCKEKVG